jgi:hypothetical protein
VGNILLISNNVTKLVTMSEVLRTVIYPFTYDDPYIPLLAPNMYKSVEAPFPCLLGILFNYTNIDSSDLTSSSPIRNAKGENPWYSES